MILHNNLYVSNIWYFPREGVHNVWLGSRRVEAADGSLVWQYSDTTDVMTYQAWAVGQPSLTQLGVEDCLAIYDGPLFHDVPCNWANLFYICEV
jgi:hypothetical protein